MLDSTSTIVPQLGFAVASDGDPAPRAPAPEPPHVLGAGVGVVAAAPEEHGAFGAFAGADGVFRNPGDAPASTTIANLGGPVIANVGVYLIFWGAAWVDPKTTPTKDAVANAVASILAGPYMSDLAQYGVGAGALSGTTVVSGSNPPNPFADGDVAAEVWALIDSNALPAPNSQAGANKLYCVVMPPGVNPRAAGVIGEHFASPKSGKGTARLAWVTNGGTLSSVTTVFSHELVEACSDPEGSTIQVNPTNPNSWNEIGDVCRSTASLNGVQVQSYWSDRAKACVIPGLDATPATGAYCAVFRPGAGSYRVIPNWDWNSMIADVAASAKAGLYPVSIDASELDGALRYAVVMRSGGPVSEIEPPTDWATMHRLIPARLAAGWRMVAIDAFEFNGSELFTGIFARGGGRQVVVPDWDWGSLYGEIGNLGAQGLRMDWVSVFLRGGVPRYAAIFHDGADAWEVVPDWPWSTMYGLIAQNKAQGRVLRSLDAFTQNGVTRYAGVFRSSGDAYEVLPNWNWGAVYNELPKDAGKGLYLVDLRDCS